MKSEKVKIDKLLSKLVDFWQGQKDCDSRRELRALVVRGSESHLGSHSLPLLLQVMSSIQYKNTPTKVEVFLHGAGDRT